MARDYTQVLEDVVKNQAIQIAQLVSQNEQLAEKLNAVLNSPSDISKSGGQLFDFEKALSDSAKTGTD